MKVKSVKLGGKSRKQTKKVNRNKSRNKKNPVVKKTVRQDGVSEYLVKKIMTDQQIAKRLGRYFPESHYSVILREDADVYSVVQTSGPGISQFLTSGV